MNLKSFCSKGIMFFILFFLFFSNIGFCGNDLQPISKVNNKKFKIAYCENDPYFNYAGTLYGILKGLSEAGWIKSIEDIPYTSGSNDAKAMWKWLSSRDMGDYIKFKENAFIQLAYLSNDEKKAALEKFKREKNIDLFIVMGTKAGKFTSKNIDHIPVLVFSTSDAVKSGIIQSVHTSGKDNLWAHVDPQRYKRQLDVFYDLFHFKKLGIVYENTELGRSLAAIDTVQDFTKEKHVEIVEYFINEANSKEDLKRYEKEIKDIYSKMATQVDAVYLTPGSRKTKKTKDYLSPFYHKKIPVFSQVGPIEVQYGALMSVYRFNFDEIGRFGADRIINVLKGATPQSLSQNFGDTPSISLNMAVAEQIGYKVPFDILLVSDIIYTKIY